MPDTFTPDNPMYPDVHVRPASGHPVALRGAVRVALLHWVSRDAADWFTRTAKECESYDELLRFVQSTVRVS